MKHSRQKRLIPILAMIAGFFFASSSLHAATETIIDDPNGDFSPDPADVVAISISEPPSPFRLLAWIDAATDATYVQLINPDNQPVSNMLELGAAGATFTAGIPASGTHPARTMQYRVVDTSGDNPSASPIVVYNNPRNEWLVAWPVVLEAALQGSGEPYEFIGVQLVGRIVSVVSGNEITAGPIRHLSVRYGVATGGSLRERFYTFGSSAFLVEAAGSHDIVFDPAASRYLLVWNARAPSNFSGEPDSTVNRIYICPFSQDLNPDAACNGPALSTEELQNNQWRLDAVLDSGNGPSQLTVAYGADRDSELSPLYMKNIRADLSDISSAPAKEILGNSAVAWLQLHRDNARDRYRVLVGAGRGIDGSVSRNTVHSTRISTFPNGGVESGELAEGSLPNGEALVHWQPQMQYASDIDAYFLRIEDASSVPEHGGAYWTAFSMGTTASPIPQAPYASLSVFQHDSSANFGARLQRSVIMRNTDTDVSVIGRSVGSHQILASRFTPFKTDLGITLNDLGDGDYAHGEALGFRVVLENHVPADGLENLAVGKSVSLRISFGSANLTPDFGDVCSDIRKVGSQWRCSLTDPPPAGEMLDVEITAETSTLDPIPLDGLNISVQAQVRTASTDPVSSNNTSETIQIFVTPSADLSVTIDSADSAVSIVGGETFEVPVSMQNDGTSTATGVALHFDLPEGITLNSANGCTPSGTSGQVSCTGVSDIAGGGSASVVFTFGTAAVPSETVNAITVSGDTSTAEGNLENNSSVFTLTRTPVIIDPPSADLTLSLTDGDNAISVVGGETAEVAYVIRNIGPNTATGIFLNVVLPEGVTLAGATGCTSLGNTCGDIINIAAGGNTPVTLVLTTAVVTEETAGQIMASVETVTGEADTSNNAHQFTLTLRPVGQDPGNPDEPGEPGNPNEPGNPDEPGTPDEPGNPDDPNDPPASGGGGAFGFALLALLPWMRRRQ